MIELVKTISYFTLIISVFVEITPIKINPVSKLLNWSGKQFNGAVMDRLQKLENKVDNNERDRIRNEIYTFANNLRNNKREYTAEEFKHIFDINEKYKIQLGGNGKVKVEMKFIEEEYLKLGGK